MELSYICLTLGIILRQTGPSAFRFVRNHIYVFVLSPWVYAGGHIVGSSQAPTYSSHVFATLACSSHFSYRPSKDVASVCELPGSP